jgi:hypothetical protein
MMSWPEKQEDGSIRPEEIGSEFYPMTEDIRRIDLGKASNTRIRAVVRVFEKAALNLINRPGCAQLYRDLAGGLANELQARNLFGFCTRGSQAIELTTVDDLSRIELEVNWEFIGRVFNFLDSPIDSGAGSDV